MKSRKYKIGDRCGNRFVIGYNEQRILIKCPLCHRITCGNYSDLASRVCICQKKQTEHRTKKRYSGLNYKNTPERILELKEKYKNGVNINIINSWIMGK